MKLQPLCMTLGVSLLLVFGAAFALERARARSAAARTELAVEALAAAPGAEYSSRSALEQQLDQLERELRTGEVPVPTPSLGRGAGHERDGGSSGSGSSGSSGSSGGGGSGGGSTGSGGNGAERVRAEGWGEAGVWKVWG